VASGLYLKQLSRQLESSPATARTWRAPYRLQPLRLARRRRAAGLAGPSTGNLKSRPPAAPATGPAPAHKP